MKKHPYLFLESDSRFGWEKMDAYEWCGTVYHQSTHKKVRFVIPTTTTDLTHDSYPNKGYQLTFFSVLPFVSLMSFLVGYRFFRQMK